MKPEPKQDDVTVKALRFISLKSKISEYEKEVKQLREELKTYCDEKGFMSGKNKLVIMPHGTDEVILRTNFRDSAPTLQANHIEIIKAELPKLSDKLIESVEVFRADIFENLCNAKRITESVIEKLYAPKAPSEAFYVEIKPKEV